MKTKKQKGFTLVELVIVIAVIAILAAVLIPTFSNLIKKANLSADEQAVKQMNTALAIYTAENGKPESAAEVKTGLSENNINTDTMTPVTKGYAFYWDKENNKIVLVGEGKATAENTWSLLTSNGYGKAPEQAVTDATTLTNAINESTIAKPVLIELTSDLTITEQITIDKEKSVIMDLNGKTINSSNTECAFEIKGGSITLENGDINVSHRLFKNVEGNLTLSNLNVKSTGAEIKEDQKGGIDTTNCNLSLIRIDGFSDTSIVRCNIETNDFYVLGCNAASKTSYGPRISIIDSTIKATGHFEGINGAAIFIPILSDVIIDGSTIEGYTYAAYFKGCNAKITNSSFKNNDEAKDTKPQSGPSGKAADIYFACGKPNQNYFSVGNYACENVTVDDVVIYEPDGGKVTLTGIDSSKITNETN